MHKLSMLLMVVFVSLITVAYAQVGDTYQPNDRGQQGDKQDMNRTDTEVTGTVQRVDLDKDSIMIREDASGNIERFKLTDSTAYSDQSPKITARSLEIGDHVQMQVESQSKRVLKIIRVRHQ